ncbi:cysteine--tRNA ligase [Micrococcus sp. 2A]|uniref:cysteine--tRNA ligase n=1 Tax=Micrococcus sp. 2A TaxID=3142261 RepID=UPI0026380445|nr:cysteine--tRNA ligase [uncultured Micrococcus sp.]
MAQRFYDTRSAQIREFTPLVPGRASVYYCGATVQGMPHVGHVRSAIVFDVLTRWLEATGLTVTSVRNVTDIDDKILDRSAASHAPGFEPSALYPAQEPWWALAFRFENAFDAAYLALGVRRPTYEPRATGHIPEMFALIRRLMDRGHAYAAQDGSGDVYFDVRSWERYGELTRQRVEDMQEAPDADPRGKRDPRDFALWKGAKDGEPATAVWESPWGAGRPGWHLECSAMSTKYLGGEFDIHGGGLDLRFPHHENELAQSAAAGDGFARFWLHNGLVTYGGEKMSKSVGNTISPEEMLGMARPTAVRYFLGQAHYRSQLDYRPGALEEAEAAVARIERFLTATKIFGGGIGSLTPEEYVIPPDFREAMENDLNVPQALSVLHEHVRLGNKAIMGGAHKFVFHYEATVKTMTTILGLEDVPEASDAASGPVADALDSLVRSQIAARAEARAAKDWAAADRIRDALAAAGVVVEDGAEGATWRLAG